ncbi:hypothetical protein EUGRSUZ_A02604 [Eucalyptus grandis]|uniref:Uncharacterized protein n=2 Tax=Eucalyptus grandis TaxID=71139 RepID=A0ACC3M7X6_EUCGR|nr:hypothetical protein EUGRSUZ_A02604 [Eucalyptus grandis]
MLWNFITRCLLFVFGYVYPAFQCYKTMAKNTEVAKNGEQTKELRQWCQYWIIVTMFTVLERFADLGFIIYLWHPKTEGTGHVYETLQDQFMKKHESKIDEKLEEWKARAWEFASPCRQYTSDFAQDAFARAMQYLASQSKILNFKAEQQEVPDDGGASPEEDDKPHESTSCGLRLSHHGHRTADHHID